MDDKTLLELAAKAAGIELLRSRLDDPMCKDFLLVERKRDGEAISWNPLTDDGDALRLAVKLGLHILPELQSVDVGPFAVEYFSNNNGDPRAATRRAIVRAAAEIGRTL